MKLGLATTTPDIQDTLPVSLLCGSFDEKLVKAAGMGYSGVELIINHPGLIDPVQIKNKVSDCGLEISSVATGGLAFLEKITLLADDPLVMEQAFERLLELISFASRLSAPIVTIGSFRGRISREGSRPGWRDLVHILQAASEAAEREKIVLVIEPLNRYETDLIHTITDGLAFIEEVGRSHLELLIDTYHMNIEETSITESIRIAAASGCLRHIHLGDSNRLAPGQGHIDFPSIFGTLETIGYEGFLTAELLAKPDPDSAAFLTADYCHRYLTRH